MFTGIIEELGTVAEWIPLPTGARVLVACNEVLSDVTLGASIAVNGVCLTAVAITAAHFAADLAPETLERSNLGALRTGDRVNLERPVTPATRLSGHIVQGHVDATAPLLEKRALGEGNCWLAFDIPAHLRRYCVEKGSITLDGISLTIAALDPLSVAIIPHTIAHTTLGQRAVGDQVNVEVDVLAKHLEALLKHS
jgi:riboflavin synthase